MPVHSLTVSVSKHERAHKIPNTNTVREETDAGADMQAQGQRPIFS